jgi:hypothetical protein
MVLAMKKIIFLLPVLLTLISLQSHALIITDVRKDTAIREGYDSFSTDMIALGYNPITDIVNSVRLYVRVHEIIDDSDTDMPGTDTSEFVIFYMMLFGARMHVYPDVDNESFEFVNSYSPNEETCVIWGMEGCDYDPVKTGWFGIGVAASTNNLWLDEARWELDITRTSIDEPSAPILFLAAILSLISCRYWQRVITKK